MRVLVLLSFLFGTFLGSLSAYRLPWTVIPQLYRLEIVTNLGDENGEFNFQGEVCIEATAVESTKNITLHSKDLQIDSNHITVNDARDLVHSLSTDAENDFIIIHLKKSLEKNKPVTFCVPFKGDLEDVLAGYYRSTYEDKENKSKKYLATTQFEPTDARRAFPCFDEPEMKAKFAISMGHKDTYTALSNMPMLKTEAMENKSGWVWTRFEETVPMSTYLVAFVVSDFGYVEAPMSQSNVTFKIWCRKDALDQVHLASEIGPKALDYYENFFGIEYPLPKQDMIAIPDFSSGAMENWGLITYREKYLLYDNHSSSESNKEGVASVIAHELAHQWFGNLVTMKWWTDLWLNEGFATYMASLAENHIFPEWNSLDEQTSNELLSVFGFDSLKSSHPVSVPVGHPREINEIFDAISYKKGSFILRMMSLFLGEDILRQGVSNYLNKNKYGNAEQDDLWNSLTEFGHDEGDFPKNLTVKTVMDTWTLQTGYPVVEVKRKNDKVELSQSRFLRDVLQTRAENNELWWIPVSYTCKSEKDFNNTKPKYWLPASDDVQTLKIDSSDPKDWLLFNIQASALYRVNYDLENWNLLTDFLNSDDYQTIPTINRIQLIDDSANLAWVNKLPYDVFFKILTYVRDRENKYVAWKAALSNLGVINQQVKRSALNGMYKQFVKQLLAPKFNSIGKLNARTVIDENGPLHSVKYKSMITTWACLFSVEDCVAQAKEIFRAFKENPTKQELIPKDLRAVVYCSVLRHGGEEEWNFLWQQYLNSNVAHVKSQILSELGCSREVWLLRRFLEWSLQDDSAIRKQDVVSVFNSVASTEIGFYVARNFLEENIKQLHKRLEPKTRRLGQLLSPLARQMTKESDYEWFQNFTAHHEDIFKDTKKSVERSLETIKLNLQWQRSNFDNVRKILESQKY